MRAPKPQKSTSRKSAKSDPTVSYDDFKEFEGKRYTGMKIGRSHKWYYDKGEWKETKITPDLWQLTYAVTKRRAGHAPEGSGVPVGTEYHWYIAAHQNVRKLNANDYTTSMTGLKFKIAHKRAESETWSASPATQRKRLIEFLRGVIDSLERDQPEEERIAARAADKKVASASGEKKVARAASEKRAATAAGEKRVVRATAARSSIGRREPSAARAARARSRTASRSAPSRSARSWGSR